MQLYTLSTLPALLQVEVQQAWQDFEQRCPTELFTELQQQHELLDSIPRVWGCSPFVSKYALQQPAVFVELATSGDLQRSYQAEVEYTTRLRQLLEAVIDEHSLLKILRHYRRREMVRIAWRDLAGWASLTETLADLSHLADALVDNALNKVYQRLTQQFGVPMSKAELKADGTVITPAQQQYLVVIGMGKLGGQELNFSSDIDLIFAYPEAGETVGGRIPQTNQEFFVRVGQQLINALHQINADGFVFRVDMRLRPFGDSGALALNFDAMEDYYQAHARDWERYALIKARAIAGDKNAGEQLLNDLKPFIYRRYLDYSAFESLRNMKALIDQETRRKGLTNNLKLGVGGIREVEFSCQVFQLIRGGRERDLQSRRLLPTLERLKAHRLLSAKEVQQLHEGYCFLRLAENHLQAIDDRQTQTLPADELNQNRLAFGLGFANWDGFMQRLQQHQTEIHAIYEKVIMPVTVPEADVNAPKNNAWQQLWLSNLKETEQVKSFLQNQALSPIAQTHIDELATLLTRFVESSNIQKQSRTAKERLDKLMPLVFAEVFAHNNPVAATTRVLRLIEATVQRSVYLSLLIERGQVLKRLVQLCGDSAWIAEQITRYPLLLDELLDHRDLYNRLNPEELDNALTAYLAHLPNDDTELLMDSMRQFKRAHVLKVAAAELSDSIEVTVASDYLGTLADTLARRTLNMAWDYLTQKYGIPLKQAATADMPAQAANFCIIAYGKAGSIELSYSSDLDLVFLHDSESLNMQTTGEQSIDNGTFFGRLVQRISHILTANTASGMMYEVDTRLRPNGSSGLLVSNFNAFLDYQLNSAWTWEHQALVRARAIAGSAESMARFESIRCQILSLVRDEAKLKQEVNDMRQKMQTHLDKSKSSHFDIKQGVGGLIEVEFIAQYHVLRWSHRYPELMNTTGVLPLFKMLKKYQLLPIAAVDELSAAYRRYRSEIHKLALQNQKALVDLNQLDSETVETLNIHRTKVHHWWEEIMI